MTVTSQARRRRRSTTRKKPELAKSLGLLDRWETAQLQAVDPSTIYRFVTEGVPTSDGGRLYLRARRIGRGLYFDETDLDAFALGSAEALRKPVGEVSL